MTIVERVAARWACAVAAVSTIGTSALAVTPLEETAATRAVRTVLAQQQADWNRGDIDAFMRGYWNDPSLRFASGDAFRLGWEGTLARYRRTYPDAAAMGRLDFDLVEVRQFSPVAVYVFGRWHLTRVADEAAHAPHGLFTLVVERKSGHWVVTRDHTSAASDR